MHIEVIVTNVEEAILAEQYGATRLELIHGFELGGLTPDLQVAKDVCNAVQIPVNIMIRPHGNSFVFNEKDMKQVFSEIDYIISSTCANAIVFGTLDDNRNINFVQLESVLRYIETGNIGLTFHRAIDKSVNPVLNFAELVKFALNSKLERVLSSGGGITAIDGMGALIEMNKIALNSTIKLLLGSGVNSSNAKSLIKLVGANEIHLGTGLRAKGKLSKELFDQLLESLK